jgi:hypothetical protein
MIRQRGVVRGRAPARRRMELPALTGGRAQPLRDHRRTRVAPGDTAAHNMEQLRRMRKGRPEDVEQRSSLLRAMRAQSMEFSQLNVEYGYTYESAALVPDGTPSPEPIDSIRICQPSTRPGAPLPHRVASPSPEWLRRAREVPFDSHATAGGVTLGVILLVIGVLGVIAAIIVYRRSRRSRLAWSVSSSPVCSCINFASQSTR